MNLRDYYYDINGNLVVDLGQTSDKGLPLYKGQISGPQCVRGLLGGPLYFLSHISCLGLQGSKRRKWKKGKVFGHGFADLTYAL